MPLESATTLQQDEGVRAVSVGTESGTGGGGGASTWDDLSGTLSGDVPFETVDENGDPVSRGVTFDDDYDNSPTPKIRWDRDPAGGYAARVRDVENGQTLLTVSEGGQTRAKTLDVEQTLTIPEKGDGAGQYIGDADFELGRSLRRDTNADPDQVDVVLVDNSGSELPTTTLGDGTEAYQISTSGQGSPTDVLEDGTEKVADATDIDFLGEDFDVSDEGGGEAGISLAEDYLLSSDYTPEADTHAKYTDADAVDAVNGTEIKPGGVDVESQSNNQHIAQDGAFYRTDGQAHITVDDKLFIRDQQDGPSSAGGTFLFETNQNKITVNGNTVWHEGNDGTGSGLDADTVDGYEGSDLAVLSEDETVTGQWTFNSNTGLGGETNPSYALDVNGQVRGQDGLRVTTASGDYEVQGDGNGNLEIITPSGNRQVMFNNGDFGAFQ